MNVLVDFTFCKLTDEEQYVNVEINWSVRQYPTNNDVDVTTLTAVPRHDLGTIFFSIDEDLDPMKEAQWAGYTTKKRILLLYEQLRHE